MWVNFCDKVAGPYLFYWKIFAYPQAFFVIPSSRMPEVVGYGTVPYFGAEFAMNKLKKSAALGLQKKSLYPSNSFCNETGVL